MKHLIIYSHLNPQSFTKAVVDEVEKYSKAKNHEVQIIDLYGDKFNPVLAMPDIGSMFMGEDTPDDVKHYQEMVSWSDHLSVVYPMWWGQMPAMLKGFVDRVFASGFAFRYDEENPTGLGLLKGKTAQLIINTGAPNEFYEPSGMHTAQKRINDDGIFGFCGIDTQIEFFGNVVMGTDEERKAYLARVVNLVP